MAGKLRCVVLILLACMLGACAATPAMDVYVTGITPLQSTLFEQRARIDLRIKNLSEKPIEATGIDLSLSVNGKRLARGVSGQPISVPRLAEGTASVEVSSGLFDTVRQILGIQERQAFGYQIRGKLYTPGLDKRFSRSGELSREDLARLVPNGAGRSGQ